MTKRCILRPTSLKDKRFILELLNSPGWLEYVGDRHIHSTSAATEYIAERMLPQYRKYGFGNFTVIRKADNVKMGTCGLYDRPGFESFDLGFAFLPDYQGRGYAFEAATRLLELAKEKNLSPIQAYTTRDNLKSRRLLDKLGFTARGEVILPGDEKKLLLYCVEL